MQMADSWSIYHVKDSAHARPKPKNKYIAVTCATPCFMGFFINSEIRPFIYDTPELLQCQVKILASHYQFLNDDSYIDCSRNPFEFKKTDLTDYRMPINIVTKAEIIKAIKNSETIDARYQKMILGDS